MFSEELFSIFEDLPGRTGAHVQAEHPQTPNGRKNELNGPSRKIYEALCEEERWRIEEIAALKGVPIERAMVMYIRDSTGTTPPEGELESLYVLMTLDRTLTLKEAAKRYSKYFRLLP